MMGSVGANHVLLPNFSLVALVMLVSIFTSACAIPHVTITNLNDGFESVSYSIPVKEPNPVYRDKHYNIPIGAYNVVNTKIESFQKTKERNSVSRHSENRTLDNLLLRGRLRFEIAYLETVAVSKKASFSFEIPFDENNIFQAACEQARIFYQVEDRFTFSLGSSKGRSNNSAAHKTWQRSIISCELQTPSGKWALDVILTRDRKPLLSLSSTDTSYKLSPLFLISAPGTFHFKVVDDAPDIDTHKSPGSIFGYTISNDSKKLASTKRTKNFGNVIQIRNELNEAETRFLIGVCQTLNMIEWLDD